MGKGCAAGDPLYDNFYYIFPDRWMPDQYDRTLREIFPTNIRAASPNWKTDAGYGRRSTPSNGT